MKKLISLSLLLCLVSFGKQPIPSLKQKQVDYVATYWQHILGLDDLIVYVRMVELSDLPDGAAGSSRCNPVLQTCFIQVLKPSAYKEFAERYNSPQLEGSALLKDIEDTIIHELVHMRLKTLAAIYSDNCEGENEHYCVMTEEMVVVRLTKSLMLLHPPMLK